MINFPPQTSLPTTVSLEKNFLDSQVVDNFLESIKNIPYKHGTLLNTEELDDYRICQVKWIPFENRFLSLYHHCKDHIVDRNSLTWKFNIDNGQEMFQYTEYNGDTKGRYNWHIDVGPGHTSYRKLSIVIQLSDPEEYEGGDLEIFDCWDTALDPFNFPSKAVPKSKGSIVIFPSYMPHRVTPVTKGIRKSLVWWVGGDHLK